MSGGRLALALRRAPVAFADANGTPPYYGGPVGDFRNESMVSELVAELGFDRVHEIDVAAALWLAKHGLATA